MICAKKLRYGQVIGWPDDDWHNVARGGEIYRMVYVARFPETHTVFQDINYLFLDSEKFFAENKAGKLTPERVEELFSRGECYTRTANEFITREYRKIRPFKTKRKRKSKKKTRKR